MEEFDTYLVITGIENIDGVDTPIIEPIELGTIDVRENYVWADEEKTILKHKDSDI